jgi:hypothetical protein
MTVRFGSPCGKPIGGAVHATARLIQELSFI